MERLKQIIPFLRVAEDRFFDWYNNIETLQEVKNDALNTESEYKANATMYAAVRCRWLRRLIRASRRLDLFPRIFLDVGCGKGKACFYAAQFGGFKRIIGFDFDASLIECAKGNLQKFGKAPITFEEGDATTYPLPEEQTFIFLYNPFDAHVMNLFLKNNLDNLRKHKHVIAYMNDHQSHVLEQMSFKKLFSDESRKMSLWQLAS